MLGKIGVNGPPPHIQMACEQNSVSSKAISKIIAAKKVAIRTLKPFR